MSHRRSCCICANFWRLPLCPGVMGDPPFVWITNEAYQVLIDNGAEAMRRNVPGSLDYLVAGAVPFQTPQGPLEIPVISSCPGLRACCFPDGSCQDLIEANCVGAGGTPLVPGTHCFDNPCPAACCFQETGGCLMLSQADCLAQGGIPQGPGTDCDPNPCPQPPPQACCFPSGACELLTPEQCVAAGGIPQGPGTDCKPNPCPPGGCCLPDQCLQCPDSVSISVPALQANPDGFPPCVGTTPPGGQILVCRVGGAGAECDYATHECGFPEDHCRCGDFACVQTDFAFSTLDTCNGSPNCGTAELGCAGNVWSGQLQIVYAFQDPDSGDCCCVCQCVIEIAAPATPPNCCPPSSFSVISTSGECTVG